MTHPNPAAPAGPARQFGKFRGVILQNLDPLQLGRVLLQVSDGSVKTPSTWALPCVPVAGMQAGVFVVPPIGSHVWVEFEQGDPDRPIWTGGFWGTPAEVPSLALVTPAVGFGQNMVLQTTGQNTVLLSDAAATPATGGIILKSADGATIVVNASGIFISNGKGATITLIGPTVDINAGALTVT